VTGQVIEGIFPVEIFKPFVFGKQNEISQTDPLLQLDGQIDGKVEEIGRVSDNLVFFRGRFGDDFSLDGSFFESFPGFCREFFGGSDVNDA